MKTEIENNLTVENIKTVAMMLSKNFKKHEDLLIDLSGVEKLDLAGIQLLLSVQKSGRQNNKPVLFCGILKKSIYEKLFNTGFNTIPMEGSEELYAIRRNSSDL
jgi:anti-anti-sigma regulatory factor